MANIRVLELAKELKVEVADVQRAAVKCGVAVSGPTSLLNAEDRDKISKELGAAGKDASQGRKAPGKTLTLNRPIVAGQGRGGAGGGSVEGRGRTVQVEVRRRRGPGVTAGAGGDASAPVKKAGETPAQRAAKAVQEKREAAKPAEQPAVKTASKPSPAAPNTPQPAATTPRQTTPRHQGKGGGERRQSSGSGGPRTTIRRGLTPAQIAASRAPASSLKAIEADISSDRAERRRDGGGGSAAAGRAERPSAPTQGPRRSPSVAVAPQPAEAPGGPQRRRGPGGGGGPGGKSQRRLTPAEKAARREYAEARHLVLTEEQEDRMARLARGSRKKKGVDKDDADFVKREVEITDPIVVGELASRMAIKSGSVVKKLFEMGIGVTVNESIDADTAQIIVEEFGHTPKVINEAAVEDVLVDEPDQDESQLQPRPPVVVVMGHVDHGKTSILDAVRRASVAEGEAGGITQHIGAYMVKLEDGSRVVFVDTPGHEAFTSLRARGASLTDVAVLVVAADDGVMPQTVEALNHAKAAGVPIIVAINKMDKEGANPERIKQQMAEHELIPEEWGGDTIFVPVSAHTGEGLPELLEMLALQTEILELKANPNLRGRGIVIEARLEKGRGPVATVLVKSGTFKQGDTVVIGTVMGRIRALIDENGVQHRTAGPSIPAEILGLEAVPEAGQEIIVVENERQARDIVSYRKDKLREQGVSTEAKAVSLEDLFANIQSDQIKEVPVLIKGDVSGSVDALAESMEKASTEQVRVRVIHKGIGGITESDIMLAAASGAIVIGFNVRPETKAKKMAEQEGIDIRFYRVIYDAIDEIKQAMVGMLEPDKVEKVIGTADVREVFSVPKLGAVAGCMVTDGIVTRDAMVRVLRDSVLVYEGKLASLRRFKDDVKEVRNGYECGIGVEKFNDIKEGDTFEFYVIEEVAATL